MRRWRWIGHVTRQEASIAKAALHWTPEGKRTRGRPKITWRRTVEKEIKEMGEDLGRHQAYGKGPADVEEACCCPTYHLGVKGMSESGRRMNFKYNYIFNKVFCRNFPK